MMWSTIMHRLLKLESEDTLDSLPWLDFADVEELLKVSALGRVLQAGGVPPSEDYAWARALQETCQERQRLYAQTADAVC